MPSSQALRVLVADDDPLQLRLAARVLRSLGHSGALATHGRMALDLLGRQAFDLLLDLRMPELDGLDTLVRLRQAGHRLPVVMVSGDDLGANWAHYRDAGADAYLVKPLDVDALSVLLRRWVG
ncbi:response regulator [Hydrogenophaga sp.]|uniref:response regulator n=1 Tax=Hydrogenophaga sp. TaxID=1904254 RepID=UPI00286E2958|nr:response regulator [Hydrogenophaga sp.]